MKTLVVYYSRTGTTRRLAHELAEALGADIEELKERTNREGAGGYMRASSDSLRRRPAELLPLTYNPADYDLVVVGGPCWTQTMCIPTRTYVMQQKDNLSNVGFFSTAGGPMFARKAVDSMTDATGLTPIATMALAQKEAEGEHSQSLAEFVATLRNAHQQA